MHVFLYTIKTGVTYCKGGDSTPDLALNDVTVGNGSLYNSDVMFSFYRVWMSSC